MFDSSDKIEKMSNNAITKAIGILQSKVSNPSEGLPDEIFYYISKTTPLLNVDLLIKHENEQTLLSWRNDQYTGSGWHVPGGIVRFKETMEDRIKKVAETEIGTLVDFDPTPIAINQIIHPERETRGHFISILFNCSISNDFILNNDELCNTDQGYLMWHDTCPNDLLNFHKIYSDFI